MRVGDKIRLPDAVTMGYIIGELYLFTCSVGACACSMFRPQLMRLPVHGPMLRYLLYFSAWLNRLIASELLVVYREMQRCLWPVFLISPEPRCSCLPL